MTLTIEDTLNRAPRRIKRFRQIVANVPYVDKGILYSEVFFIDCVMADSDFNQIVESGRARAQSTLLLSLCFTDKQIVSIERNPDSPDAPIAAQRLEGRNNVTCLFGDSRQLMPEHVGAGDAVLIDGPKDFRALKLAAKLAAHNRPSVLFIHDCYRGWPVRRWIEQHVPWAFFADDNRFAELCGDLDDRAGDKHPGLACIPCRKGFPTLLGRMSLTWERLTVNFKRSVEKRVS